MQLRSIKYPILSIYELLRSVTLLRQGALTAIAVMPVTWYAGLPMLCLMPFLFIMLGSDENAYASWLPLAGLAKALGTLSLAVFIVQTVPDALRFASAGDISYAKTAVTALFFGIADATIGVYCFRRNRTLCR